MRHANHHNTTLVMIFVSSHPQFAMNTCAHAHAHATYEMMSADVKHRHSEYDTRETRETSEKRSLTEITRNYKLHNDRNVDTTRSPADVEWPRREQTLYTTRVYWSE